MSLDFQPISIVFSGGLDTKADPKTVQANKLLELQNGVFTRPGIIAKRFGNNVLSRSIVGGTSSITAAQAVAVSDDELLIFSGTHVYSWSPALKAWLDRGAVSACTTAEVPVLRNSASQANVDVAVSAGIRLVAWEDSRGGVRYSVQDAASGAFFVSDVLAKSTATQPKCVAFNGELLLFYTVGANLYYRRISLGTPYAVGVEVNPISTMRSATNAYAVLVVAGRLFIGWNDNLGDAGAPKANIAYLDTGYVLSAYSYSTAEGSNGIALAQYGATQNIALVYADTTAVRVKAFTYNLGSASVAGTLEAIANVVHVGAAVVGTSNVVTVFYEVQVGGLPGGTVRMNTVNFASSVTGTPADVIRGVGLWAEPTVYNGVIYLGVARSSPYQSVYFVIDSTGFTVAKVAPEVGGGLRTHTGIATFSQVSAGVFEIGYVELGRYVTDEGAPGYALPGAKVIRVDFTAPARWATAKLRNNLLIGGGVVQMYDGYALGEAGFHQWPEGLTVATAAVPTIAVTTPGDASHKETYTITFVTSRTFIAAGQYWTCFTASDATKIMVFYNVDGVSRHPPNESSVGPDIAIEVSILSSDDGAAVAAKTATALVASGRFTSAVAVANVLTIVNLANGTATDAAIGAAPYGICTGPAAGTYQYTAIYERTDNFGQIHRSAPATPVAVTGTGVAQRFTIPTLRITSWPGTRVVLYRTKTLGTVFHRLTPISAPIANSKTVDSVTATDGLASDTDIGPLEALYTTGGILEADAPAGSNLLVTYKDRVFLSGQANPYALKFSTVTPVGEAVYFNDELSITVDQRGGPITALAVLDDKLLIFKESAIFALAGDGPTSAGDGQDYGAPSLITTDTGCSNPTSIVVTPQGVMFQTPKGFYLLDRGLNCSYLGEQIEKYNAATVTGAQVAPNTNQIRFVSNDAPALVFDYLAGEWATFTGFEAVGCAVWRGAFVFVKSDGRVFVEDQTVFTDGGVFVPLVIVTSNIAPAGQLQTWSRVRELRVLGTFKTSHKLRVSIATDYNDAYTQEADWDAGALYATTTYGAGSPYGSDPIYGGPWLPYQFRARVTRAKCQAIRVRIEDTQASGYNEGMAINGLALLVGMKRGLARVPASRQA